MMLAYNQLLVLFNLLIVIFPQIHTWNSHMSNMLTISNCDNIENK